MFNADEAGVVFAVKAGREFALLGQGDVGETCWGSPAPARGALYVRGVEHLIRIPAGKRE